MEILKYTIIKKKIYREKRDKARNWNDTFFVYYKVREIQWESEIAWISEGNIISGVFFAS